MKKKITDIKWEIDDYQVLRPVIMIEDGCLKLDHFQDVVDLEISIGDLAEVEDGKIVGFDYRKASGFLHTPELCPKCKGRLVVQDRDIVCVNVLCPVMITRFIYNLVGFTGFINRDVPRFIKGETRTIMECLKSANIISIKDFFDRGNEGLGVFWRRVNNIKNVTICDLINLLPYNYKTHGKTIGEYFGSLENFMNASEKDFMSIPDHSDEYRIKFMCDSIKFRPLINEITKFYDIKPIKSQNSDSPIKNIKICLVNCFQYEEYGVILDKVKEFCGIKCGRKNIPDLYVVGKGEIEPKLNKKIEKSGASVIGVKDFCKILDIEKLTIKKKCTKQTRKDRKNVPEKRKNCEN